MSNTAIIFILVASMVGLVAAFLALLGWGIHHSTKHEIHLLRYRNDLLRTRGRREADRVAH
jgi:hypothetical protein